MLSQHRKAQGFTLFQRAARMSTSLMKQSAKPKDGRIMLHVCTSVPDDAAYGCKDALLLVNTEVTEEQKAKWQHVWRWGGVLGPEFGRHSAQCVCCVGQGGLSAFLLAQAQQSVLGRCEPYRSVWVICCENEAQKVRNRLRKEGFLNSFYQFPD
ncbi:Hypothetical protein APO_0356 [Acetobacter pomorum DM001]|uniref:Uncharacterized protein n=2 Tax=Acetobacteraceae TaxID=433 RepID=F1YR34_9PROT|nr:Hypothetical protein APO_0356 [Acetobacter pomorum DM001]